MNKPAAKEPSMDEILSSIRQIIADDDAATAKPAAAKPAAPAPAVAKSAPDSMPSFSSFSLDEEEVEAEPALTLSPSQIVSEAAKPASDPVTALHAEAKFGVDETAGEAEEEPFNLAAELVVPDDIAFDSSEEVEVEAPEPPRQRASSPMPDATLSSELAERLLAPATGAAVGHAFARLGSVGLGTQGLTIEAMIRDMLRPMLKDWLDENLPAMVEQMVEKEIERVSRGLR